MATEPVMFGSLALTMALFSLALGIAWARFGRQLHVALWSAAFVAAAISNAGLMVMMAWPPAARPGAVPVTVASLVCASLFSQGFRKRAGLKDWRGVAVVTLLMIGACAALIDLRPDDYHNRVVVDACETVLFLLSAQALRADPRGRTGATRATFWMLASFSSFVAGLTALAIVARPGGPVAESVYDLVVLLGSPAGLAGLGLFSMLLVASDLSERLQRLASLDPLTGVLNRRGFDYAAGRMLAQCLRFERPFTIVVADLDRFKSINDRFGHAMGDLVLQRFAAHCEAVVREGDLVGRLGGEEFVIVLADAGPAAAAEAMERLRIGLPAALEDLALAVPVTASFGIATQSDRDDTLATMLVRADGALYGAKGSGRDRITVASSDPPTGTEPRFLAAFAREGASGDEWPDAARL